VKTNYVLTALSKNITIICILMLTSCFKYSGTPLIKPSNQGVLQSNVGLIIKNPEEIGFGGLDFFEGTPLILEINRNKDGSSDLIKHGKKGVQTEAKILLEKFQDNTYIVQSQLYRDDAFTDNYRYFLVEISDEELAYYSLNMSSLFEDAQFRALHGVYVAYAEMTDEEESRLKINTADDLYTSFGYIIENLDTVDKTTALYKIYDLTASATRKDYEKRVKEVSVLRDECLVLSSSFLEKMNKQPNLDTTKDPSEFTQKCFGVETPQESKHIMELITPLLE